LKENKTMRSNKSMIRTTAAALAIGLGLAAFGGTALADPGYQAQGGWHRQGQQQGWQQPRRQNNWQRHGWQNRGNYQHSRYHGGWGNNGWQHQRWGHPHYDREGYHVMGTQGYYAPPALSFSINLPLAGGQYGH
jgi:hypothetical protein